MNLIERYLPHGPAAIAPTLIVVHCMAYQIDHEGERLYAAEFLDRVRLSAHVLVAPDGTLIRCRRDDQGAYHAKGYNATSFGIEVLCPDVYDLAGLQRRTAQPGWVTPAQLDAVVAQVAAWKTDYAIRRIARHCDLDPTRRWFDPGAGFPWAELLRRTWACGTRATA